MPDIIINDTTGGGFDMTMDERLACLDAKPEMASLNLVPDMSEFRLKERESRRCRTRAPSTTTTVCPSATSRSPGTRRR